MVVRRQNSPESQINFYDTRPLHERILYFENQAIDSIMYQMPVTHQKMREMQQSQNISIKHSILTSRLVGIATEDILSNQTNESIEMSAIQDLFKYFSGRTALFYLAIQQGALMHDNGKYPFDKEINKTGKLDPAERDYLVQHILFGVDTIEQDTRSDINLPFGLYKLFTLFHHSQFLNEDPFTALTYGITRLYLQPQTILETLTKYSDKVQYLNPEILAALAHKEDPRYGLDLNVFNKSFEVIWGLSRLMSPDMQAKFLEKYHTPSKYTPLLKGLINLIFTCDVSARCLYGIDHKKKKDCDSTEFKINFESLPGPLPGLRSENIEYSKLAQYVKYMIFSRMQSMEEAGLPGISIIPRHEELYHRDETRKDLLIF
jgi:hypothetical protein